MIIIFGSSHSRKLKNLTHFSFRGHELSPIKHLYLKDNEDERAKKVEILDNFVDKVMFNELELNFNEPTKILIYFRTNIFQCIEQKLAIANAAYLESSEKFCPEPSLRITANRLFDDNDIDFVFNTIESISSELFN